MRFVLTFSMLTFIAGCSGSDRSITLATTTSTRDSGLLDALLPPFEGRTGIQVKVVAVGSGQALEMGRRGDADVLLTHAPDAEKQLVAEGHGLERLPVMYNDFVVVGPDSDPAGIKGMKNVVDAFRKIAGSRAELVSRGDNSGTHMKEKTIWKRADIEPKDEWYIEVGSGMAQTLRIASEKAAYILTDRGTFLAHRKALDLKVMCEGDPLLLNHYSVIVIDPKKHPSVRHADAQQFADYLASDEARRIIEEHGVAEHGQPLFFPSGEK